MKKDVYQQYLDAERFLETLHQIAVNKTPKWESSPARTFARSKLFLKLLGNPDKAYRIIHIAGTSGKGSTANAIASILQTAGYRVGLHTQPFVSVATEKLSINGKNISPTDFIQLVQDLKPTIAAVAQKHSMPSYFETWMMATFLYCQQQHVDFLVLETGCGGTYDASNAALDPEIAVITTIGYDHQHLLGNTLTEIAGNKAGIIRKHQTVVSSMQRPAAAQVIRTTCQKQGATLIEVDAPTEPNEAMATTVAHVLGISDATITKGLRQRKPLPARFEIMQRQPLVILDGAHNQDKLAYLATKLKTFLATKQKSRVHLVAALSEHKNPRVLFKPIMPLVHTVYATRFLNPYRKSASPDVVARAFSSKKVTTYLDPVDALQAALKNAQPNDVIIVTGSFFLCSNVRSQWLSERKLLAL